MEIIGQKTEVVKVAPKIADISGIPLSVCSFQCLAQFLLWREKLFYFYAANHWRISNIRELAHSVFIALPNQRCKMIILALFSAK